MENKLEKEKKISIIIRMAYFSLHFIATIFINRSLTVAFKGEYAYIINFVSIFSIVGGMGLDLLYLEYTKKYGDKVLGIFLGITYSSSFLFICIAVVLLVLHRTEFFWIMILTSMHLLYQNISMFACVKNITLRNVVLLIVQIIYVSILGTLYFTDSGNVDLLLLLYGINDLSICLLLIKRNKFRVNWEMIKENDTVKIQTIIKLGIKAMLISLLIVFNYNIDIIMLKKLGVDLGLIGIYSVAVTLSNIILLVPDAFKELALGEVVRKNVAHKIYFYLKTNIYFMIIISIGFVLLGKWFIGCFYGKQYISAFNITLILFMGDLFICIYKIIHPLLIADGKQTQVLIYLIIAVMSNVGINLVMIPKFNIYGAAVASVISYLVTGVLFFISFKKNYLEGSEK